MEESNFTELRNTVLRVVYFREPPFVNNVDLDDGHREGHHDGPGVVMDILKIVSEQHNIKYNFTETSDGVFGQQLPNGSWDGMIGMLHRNEVDIIAGNTIVNEDRKRAVDFTLPFMTTASGMLIRSPDQFIDNRFLIVTAPLEFQVWLMIGAAIIVSGLVFKGICAGLSRLNKEYHFSLFDCVWTFYAIFVQQDLSRLPSGTATRTMLSFWWLASLSISGFFTGNMVALFAVTRSTLPFNTRDGMVEKVKNGHYKVVLQNTSTARMQFIKNSGLDVFQDLWSAMYHHGKWINVSTLEEGIQIVINQPKLVFIAAKESLDALASQICSVTTLDGDLIPVWYSIATRKNSSYAPLFNDVIKKLSENGFVEKWLRDARIMQAYERGTRCNTSLGAGIGAGGNIEIAGDAITIEKAQGVFWLIVAGTLSALICFIIERVWTILRPQPINITNNVPGNQNRNENTGTLITVKPFEASSSPLQQLHQDLIESVDSYRPKSQAKRKSRDDGSEKRDTNGNDQMLFNKEFLFTGANFQPHNYEQEYVSVIGTVDHDDTIETAFQSRHRPFK